MHIRSPILPLFTALALSCHHEPDATPPASPGVPAATSPAASPTAARSDSEVALSAQVLASLRHRGLAAHTVELTLRPGLPAAACGPVSLESAVAVLSMLPSPPPWLSRSACVRV